ncbi:uncharacterized protein MYCFIDRAFT_82074 [Pseudocercospora fijiensis CIRAD86]|uniref:Uncharacterized protein n=1 Tax=Pseudocercospora fijiensis (strain CIRAD86) TaxID=383855 RepID=M2Z8M2_PSEFD|nr:uncharacterized protein MYCFIDRAFT_82074 [Pseudocercospora fijiensis CIRAD86]EME86135.1 hypothetical protein MYCFIDRAFT_82074 [Pseudocercospora fijiensis CIRAD86]
MAADDKDIVCPSPRAMAFAISVVRSKPPELAVAEYIRLLRQHIAQGRRENALSSVYRHLDRSAFWRSEFERTKDALHASESQAVDLQLEIEKLKTKMEHLKSNAPNKKRKKQDIDTIPVPRSPKRPKRESSPPRALSAAVDFSFEAEYHGAGKIASKGHHNLDENEIAHHLLRATSALPQIIQREVERITAEGMSDNNLLGNALTVCSRAASAVIVAYSKLSPSSGIAGKATHAVVLMFKDFLRDFELVSVGETKNAPDSDRDASASLPTKPKGKAKAGHFTNIRSTPRLSLYANFLASTIDRLDPNNEMHKALYEGFAYCLLERLGDRLYTTVFGQRRAPTLEDEILRGAAVDTSNEGEAAKHSSSTSECEETQMRLEAPYLIHLLNRLMLSAPEFLGSSKGRKNNAKSATKMSLSLSARESLQRTLVNCVFGVREEGDDDLFKECLKMPHARMDSIPLPKIKEANVQDWFKDELWRLLGWEILAKEGEW